MLLGSIRRRGKSQLMKTIPLLGFGLVTIAMLTAGCEGQSGSEMAPVQMLDCLERADLERLANLSFREAGFPSGDVVSAEGAGGTLHYKLDRTEARGATEAIESPNQAKFEGESP